jgi:hypothetical protein
VVGIGDTRIAFRRVGTQTIAVPPEGGFGRVVGMSAEMRRLYPMLERLSLSSVPVILEGETGTGKELVAEAIHEASARRGTVRCLRLHRGRAGRDDGYGGEHQIFPRVVVNGEVSDAYLRRYRP